MYLCGGRSGKDRINFHTKTNSITAIKQKHQSIKFEIESTNKQDTHFKKNILNILALFAIPSLIKALLLIPLIENRNFSVIWYLVPAFFYTAFMVVSIISIRKEEGIEFLRNHAAEHMVYAAYSKLKRIPSMQEVKKFSRIAKNCGVTTFSSFITFQLIGFIVYVYTGVQIFEIILLLTPLFFRTVFPFNIIGKLAQFFTTSKPKGKHIRLAIASLYALEMLELRGEDAIANLNNGYYKLHIN